MFNSLVGYPVLSPQDGPMSWPLAAMNRRKSSRWSPLKAKDLHFKRWEKMQLLRAVDQVAKHFGNDFCNDFRRSSLARLLKCWTSQTQLTNQLTIFFEGNILSPSFSMHFSMHLLGNNIIHNLEDGNWRCDQCSFLAARFGFPIQHLSAVVGWSRLSFRQREFPTQTTMQQMSGKAKSWFGGVGRKNFLVKWIWSRWKGANEYRFLWLRIP